MIRTASVVTGVAVLLLMAQLLLVSSFLADGAGEGFCLLFSCASREYVTRSNVTEPSTEIGFDAGPEDLKFGLIPRGGSGKRSISVGNPGSTPSRIALDATGNISPYIHFSRKDFILESGDTAEVYMEFSTDEGMETGLYEGHIVLRRVYPSWGGFNFMLGWFQ